MLRAGLWLYDRLSGRGSLPGTKALSLKRNPAGAPLQPKYRRGFEYSDCCVDDARLVILNAVDAAKRGAFMNPRTRCLSAERSDTFWRLVVRRTDEYDSRDVFARVLVNAAGPWVNEVQRNVVHIEPRRAVRLDKGSHIVVRRVFSPDRAYLFQNADRRVVFAIPFESDFTLIGTTEVDYRGDPAAAAITDAETDYLLSTVNGYFREPVTRDDIAWSYSGVRSLVDQPGAAARKLSRDYVLDVDRQKGPPLLTVYGGKITTYRKLAEAALAQLAPFLGAKPPWTANAPLPGGDTGDMTKFAKQCDRAYPFMGERDLHRLIAAYGTRVKQIIGAAGSEADLGRSFGAGLTEAELSYLMTEEWARTAEDILWRRSKLGLQLTPEQIARVDQFVSANTKVHVM
jgi:glycerol-3-phosphate dehydrogenase